MPEEIEIKKLCLVRVPPGDRWAEPSNKSIRDEEYVNGIFPSLTEALNHIFQKTGIKDFRISAGTGQIFTITTEIKEPEKPPMYSLYGENH